MFLLVRPLPEYGIVIATPAADAACSAAAAVLFVLFIVRHGQDTGNVRGNGVKRTV